MGDYLPFEVLPFVRNESYSIPLFFVPALRYNVPVPGSREWFLVVLTSIYPSPVPVVAYSRLRRNSLWVAAGRVQFSEAHMGKKLYVGNLTYGVTDSTLLQMFEPHGTVQSAQVIMDRDTGRSKGFGFVEMGSDKEAQAAIQALNGKEVEGRALTVNEAKPREDRGGGRGGYGGGRGGSGGRGGYGGGRDRRY